MSSLIPLPFDATTEWVFLVWASYNLSVSKNKLLKRLHWIAQLYCNYTESMSLINKVPRVPKSHGARVP